MYTPDDITNALESSIKDFDLTVSNVVDLLTFNPKQGIWTELWNLAQGVSTAVSTVAVCMAVIYAYLAIIKQGLTLKGDFRKIITIVLRLCITKGMIDYSTDFMFWIYSFGAKITQLSNGAGLAATGDNLSSLLNDDAKNAYLAGLGLNSSSKGLECLFGWMQTKCFFGVFFWGLGIALMIIALSRILKLYILAMFSSIAFAKLPYTGYDGIKEFINTILALSLQGAVMIGAVALYKFCIVRAGDIGSFYTGSMFGQFGVMTVLSICLILIIAKSETIAKKIV